jgi:rhamnogalacturonyl hydrolase YesR
MQSLVEVPLFGGRAMGWYITGLVKTLELLISDESLLTLQHLQARYVDLAGAITKAADPVTSAWW